MAEIDMWSEVAKVREECESFERVILPRMITDDVLEWDDRTSTVAEAAGSMDGWRRVARHLAAALPRPGGESAAPLNDAFLREFLRIQGKPDVRVRSGRICWNISLFLPPDAYTEAAKIVLEEMHGAAFQAEDPGQYLLEDFGAVRSWLLGHSPDDDRLWNMLTWFVAPLSTVRPAAAREFLDPEVWISRNDADPSLTPAERASRAKLLDGHFRYIVNNALLHVLGALASDHFGEIAGYVDHPCLVGSYTHLMPHYLTATLYRKVTILRQFAAPGPPGGLLVGGGVGPSGDR